MSDSVRELLERLKRTTADMHEAYLLVERLAEADSVILEKEDVLVELCSCYFIRFWGRVEFFVGLCRKRINPLGREKRSSELENLINSLLYAYGLGTLERSIQRSLGLMRQVRNNITHGGDNSIQDIFVPEMDRTPDGFVCLKPSEEINLSEEKVESLKLNLIEIEKEEVQKDDLDGPFEKIFRLFKDVINFFTLLMGELYILVNAWGKIVCK